VATAHCRASAPTCGIERATVSSYSASCGYLDSATSIVSRSFLPALRANVQQDSVDLFDEGLSFGPVRADAAVDRSGFRHRGFLLNACELQNRGLPLVVMSKAEEIALVVSGADTRS
jgi:hypothetical protein